MKQPLLVAIFFSVATLFSQDLPLNQILPRSATNTEEAAKLSSKPLLRARYNWNYVGIHHSAKRSGTLNVLLEPVCGRVVLEIRSFGELLVLLDGDSRRGYKLSIPLYGVNQKIASLSMVPIPILSCMTSPDDFYQFLTSGSGNGAKILRRDSNGPVKLQYSSIDENGLRILVHLKRMRWELGRKIS